MTERRRLAHEVRNGINTLVLTVQCLPISQGDDLVECIDAILDAADSVTNSSTVNTRPDETAA